MLLLILKSRIAIFKLQHQIYYFVIHFEIQLKLWLIPNPEHVTTLRFQWDDVML
jgi:hypothetical protein